MTTVQGIPSKFDHKKILKVIKKTFGTFERPSVTKSEDKVTDLISACNGTIISDTESKGMGEVIQLQGDHRSKIRDFLIDAEEGLGLDEKTIKVRISGPATITTNIYLRSYRSTASKEDVSVVPQLSGLDT